MDAHLAAALRRARRLAEAPAVAPRAATGAPARASAVRVAIGDPQAPLERFLGLLHQHGLLSPEGWLRDDVFLLSIGDHFDWGTVSDRGQATADATAILAWLAAHPADQVVLIAGNHDLSRVIELAGLDDAGYARARAEADALYRGAAVDVDGERRFLARYPQFASAESLARDLSAFSVVQRTLVSEVLRAGRFRFAFAASDTVLCVHGAVTHADLALAGVAPAHHADPRAIALALNAHFDAAVGRWAEGAPLDLRPLHQSQSARTGDGRGILYQRPAHPDLARPDELRGPPRRRYDPRTLPRRLLQVVGHIRDHKCRELLGPWVTEPPRPEGALRHLLTDGERVRYSAGPPPSWDREDACVLFIDGGMNHAELERYALLDLDTHAQLPRVEH